MGLFSRKTKQQVSPPSPPVMPITVGGAIASPAVPISGSITISTNNVGGTLANGNGNIAIGYNAISNNYGTSHVLVGTTAFTQPYSYNDRVANEYFNLFLNKVFEHKTENFKNQLFGIFKNKTFDELHKIMSETFSSDGIEFLDGMTEQEIINYFKITT